MEKDAEFAQYAQQIHSALEALTFLQQKFYWGKNSGEGNSNANDSGEMKEEAASVANEELLAVQTDLDNLFEGVDLDG